MNVRNCAARWLIIAMGVFYIFLSNRHAKADDTTTEEPFVRNVVLEAQAGRKAPLGQLGVAVDVDLLRWLSLSAGIGSEAADSYGNVMRLSIMPRARLWSLQGSGISLWAGMGLEKGELDSTQRNSAATHFDAEVSVEKRWQGGFRLRLFGGLGELMGAAEPEGGARVPSNKGYWGLGLGYAVSPNPIVTRDETLPLRNWYGWQSLGLTFLGVAMFSMPSAFDGSRNTHLIEHAGAWDAGAVFLFSGPLVHFAHRHYGRAVGSAALRALLPLAGIYVGGGVKPYDSNTTLATEGAVVGAVLAAVIDAWAMSSEVSGPRASSPVVP